MTIVRLVRQKHTHIYIENARTREKKVFRGALTRVKLKN